MCTGVCWDPRELSHWLVPPGPPKWLLVKDWLLLMEEERKGPPTLEAGVAGGVAAGVANGVAAAGQPCNPVSQHASQPCTLMHYWQLWHAVSSALTDRNKH